MRGKVQEHPMEQGGKDLLKSVVFSSEENFREKTVLGQLNGREPLRPFLGEWPFVGLSPFFFFLESLKIKGWKPQMKVWKMISLFKIFSNR